MHKENDARFSRFGLAPKSKADYAFLLHDLYHLKPNGIMAIVLPHGVLFRGGEEGTIRRNLIENDHLETIIGLPPNIFFGTGIPTIILVLRQRREASDVLIVDASKGCTKEGKNNKLRASDIKKIADTVTGRLTVPRYSRLVPKTEIQANDYNLNIPRYVDSSDPAERWDLYASMFGGIPVSELEALADFWKAFPGLRAALFTDNGTPYVELSVENLSLAIWEHPEVAQFRKECADAVLHFTDWVQGELLGKMLTLDIPRQEAVMSEALFARMAPLPLVDKYKAYQVLDDHWQPIAVDLEILQTEGFDAARVVDPNLVEKTVKGEKAEVQDGWKGRILPFDLVQTVHHMPELDALRQKETRLSEISASIEATLEGFSEEEKETATAAELLSEEGDTFVAAAVAKEAKALEAEARKAGKFDPESYEARIIQVAAWLAEEKTLKAAIKKEAAALHLKTKATIEGLNDEQVNELLEAKWISPLIRSLHDLPSQLTDELTAKLEALAEKYRLTFAATAHEIAQTETALAGMIEELDANEFDRKGLAELKTLLARNNDE